VHRDEKIACEKIRVEVAERRRETQLFGGEALKTLREVGAKGDEDLREVIRAATARFPTK
jgi:hypothetical protein